MARRRYRLVAMRRHEAEEEAERRNLGDERRHQLLFYALDESAGLAEDAWQVATRLRRADEFQWELPGDDRPAAATAVADDAPDPQPAAAAAVETATVEPEPAPAPKRERAPRRRRMPRPRRGERLMRAWGYFVMLVGVLFIATTLTIGLGFRTYLQVGPVVLVVLVAAGVFAIWVGAQIARPPH